jgi:hypothetical protein
LLLETLKLPPGHKIICVELPFTVTVPLVAVVVTVPALTTQPLLHWGSVNTTGLITGAPGAEYTAVTVQLPPFPAAGGNCQF